MAAPPNAVTLYPDVALLQLHNGSALVLENRRPIEIDWYTKHWTNCVVSFAQNASDGQVLTLQYPDVHRVCERQYGRLLTTCTEYGLRDATLCVVSIGGLAKRKNRPLRNCCVFRRAILPR